ncbi:acyltransferase [Roseiconus lacunae]|uniref:acyltransferase n=1 Tax=Roseiconus lacunae TaxID=2605694 RepID=UPI0011F168B7|nr:acyltransferase [Roseiconus lacunae]
MLKALKNVARGLRLLRHPELIADLGSRQSHLNIIHEIRSKAINLRLSSDIVLNHYQPDALQIHEDVSIGYGCVLSFGDLHNGHGKISIGPQTWLGPYNNLRSGGGEIKIGSGCLISQFCTLVASHHSTVKGQWIRNQPPTAEKRDVVLGDDVWLGAGVTVTAGVQIRTGAVIGAGAVVVSDVPAEEIWAGVPARKIGVRQ